MDYPELDKDRFLQKDPDQGDQTKSAVYTSVNPVPKKGTNDSRKWGQANDSREDSGAPNILTGTVIVSCFIQTSALPSRVEIQGNDITFFDDTVSQNGKVVGDTSRIVFTHGSGKSGGVIESGFILQKRALSTNTYDNVLELFSPDNSPNTNYVFIGRMGTGAERNISLVEIAPDYRSAIGDSKGYINGVFRVRTSRDGLDNNYRDGLYIMDRGTESHTRNGSIDWLVAAGEGGQVRLSYMPSRSGNPFTDPIFELFISASGFTFFGLPTINPGGSGRLWNSGGTLKIT